MKIHASHSSSECRPLPADFRRVLECSWDADLSAARVHAGPGIDALLDRWDVAGAATGSHIFVASAFREGEPAWNRIVAHEAAHVLQQARGAAGMAGALSAREHAPVLELAAEAAAGAALAGRRYTDTTAVCPEREPVVQGFNAWEHQMLGDLAPAEIVEVANRTVAGQAIVKQMLTMLLLWQTNPGTVTVADIQRAKPGLAVLQLATSQCLATRGELNAISADFVANPNALNQLPTDVVFPLLQQVRQETYNRLNALIGIKSTERFPPAITEYTAPDPNGHGLAEALETREIDEFTIRMGLGVNHYAGLLARNACHFAPFGWHRWRAFHEQARALAAQAHTAQGPQKATLTGQAWAAQCYADHFLHDAFAAGHLINKTLIMQWFTQWLIDTFTTIPVTEWDSVKNVTATNEPMLSGPALYDPLATAPSNDPQTAEEQSSYSARIAATALGAYGPVSVREAYRQYLDFLDATVIQLSSNQVHNYFNENGLTVKSVAAGPFRLFGDESLLHSPDAAEQAALAVQSSQKSVADILAGGSTPIGVNQVLNLVPSQVVWGGQFTPLKDWHAGPLKQFCTSKIFGGLKPLVVGVLSPHMGTISVDQATGGMRRKWQTVPKDAGAGFVSMLWSGQRLFAGAGGHVYELDINTGATRAAKDLGRYGEVRLAASDTMVFAGVSGRLYACDATAVGTQKWESNFAEAPAMAIVDVYFNPQMGRVFAGTYGNVYAQASTTGARLAHSTLPGYGHAEVRVAGEEGQTFLFAGTNGYAMSLDPSTLHETWHRQLATLGADVVNLLLTGRQLFAGATGCVYELDRNTGAELKTNGLKGLGHNEVRLAASDDTLFVATSGTVVALRRSDVSQALWTQNLGYFDNQTTTSVLVAEGNLFAAVSGVVYQLDPANGHIMYTNKLPGLGYHEVRMATDEATLAVGTYGTAVGIALDPVSVAVTTEPAGVAGEAVTIA